MRETTRAERQRATQRALYERFAAGSSSHPDPLAAPSAPELTGLGYYQLQPVDPETSGTAGASGAQPATEYIPVAAPAEGQAADPEQQPRNEQSYDNYAGDSAPAADLVGQPLDAQDEAGKKQRRKRTKRRRNLVMLAVVLVFALVVAGSVLTVKSVLKQFNPDDYPGPGGEAVEFTVEDGWGVQVISRKLEELDVVSSDKLFAQAVEQSTAPSKVIHPGNYLLKKQMRAADAAGELINNKPDKVFYVALKANLRMPAALEEIAKGSGLELAELTKLAAQPKKFGLPAEVKNLEGWLHPGEYRFALDTSAQKVLQSLVDATKKSLKAAGEPDLSKGYRALKIASIMQAEATVNDYPAVAGAIENRLHKDNTETHGLLQVDSAVIYGLDRYTLQFSAEERADKSNAYNTYVHPGLPPTPIGSPSNDAIKAAVNPAPNDYYYWVTVNTQTGETKFAATYAEHQQNQAEFRAWCAANADVCQ